MASDKPDLSSFLDRPASTSSLSPLYASTATVPGIFRRRSVNLIIGKSRVGRMRFALTHLNAYADQVRPAFLDREVIVPVQLGCVIGLQDPDQLLHDLRAMGLENLTRPGAFPVVSYRPSRSDDCEPYHPMKVPYEAFAKLPTCPANPKFLLIENLQSLLPSGEVAKQKDVAGFMDQLREFANHEDCTILGTVGTPKMLKGQGYPSLPERILGCIQWAEGSDTLIGIDEVMETAGNGLNRLEAQWYRKITVMPAGAQEFQVCSRFEPDGRLVPCDWPQAEGWSVTGQPGLEARLAKEREGKRFGANEFYGWGMQMDLHERLIRRWLKVAVNVGLLAREGQGPATVYIKPRSN